MNVCIQFKSCLGKKMALSNKPFYFLRLLEYREKSLIATQNIQKISVFCNLRRGCWYYNTFTISLFCVTDFTILYYLVSYIHSFIKFYKHICQHSDTSANIKYTLKVLLGLYH